ncbi:MAG: hypothetical protein COT89_02415 [Candidatus Colwellbacteria bacterium CG10_big_fil_rev_8_21_14_0_10_42_22]|uniref:Rhodanese domain-containing protein n=1 Tax=Candidatus Colwellbacteria bacterium CG10_big_fil_rev_8_21_14_0_10_42_22 TaxID=1974540 RepID=A0A2H0VFN8_9BACT|nr:MAG: hypothetical protein COT89_02415 [Candidatus Colwellbacteria bacterium CG10_big_fil_rev_8_21_14_0_10_42_22]
MEEIKSIDRDRLRGWVSDRSDFVLVDIRDSEDYKEMHIPGAKNIGLESKDFLGEISKLASDKKTTVVIYCYAGNSSPKVAEKLVKVGYEDVYDFSGGMDDWEDAGYPVEKNGQMIYR